MDSLNRKSRLDSTKSMAKIPKYKETETNGKNLEKPSKITVSTQNRASSVISKTQIIKTERSSVISSSKSPGRDINRHKSVSTMENEEIKIVPKLQHRASQGGLFNRFYDKFSNNVEQYLVNKKDDVKLIGNHRFSQVNVNEYLEEKQKGNIYNRFNQKYKDDHTYLDNINKNIEFVNYQVQTFGGDGEEKIVENGVELKRKFVDKQIEILNKIELTPLPVKVKKNNKDKAELDKVERSAVIMRRMEYEFNLAKRKSLLKGVNKRKSTGNNSFIEEIPQEIKEPDSPQMKKSERSSFDKDYFIHINQQVILIQETFREYIRRIKRKELLLIGKIKMIQRNVRIFLTRINSFLNYINSLHIQQESFEVIKNVYYFYKINNLHNLKNKHIVTSFKNLRTELKNVYTSFNNNYMSLSAGKRLSIMNTSRNMYVSNKQYVRMISIIRIQRGFRKYRTKLNLRIKKKLKYHNNDLCTSWTKDIKLCPSLYKILLIQNYYLIYSWMNKRRNAKRINTLSFTKSIFSKANIQKITTIQINFKNYIKRRSKIQSIHELLKIIMIQKKFKRFILEKNKNLKLRQISSMNSAKKIQNFYKLYISKIEKEIVKYRPKFFKKQTLTLPIEIKKQIYSYKSLKVIIRCQIKYKIYLHKIRILNQFKPKTISKLSGVVTLKKIYSYKLILKIIRIQRKFLLFLAFKLLPAKHAINKINASGFQTSFVQKASPYFSCRKIQRRTRAFLLKRKFLRLHFLKLYFDKKRIYFRKWLSQLFKNRVY
jgi:hypothetical protein